MKVAFVLMLIILIQLYERENDMCSYTDCDAGLAGITEILLDVLKKTRRSLDTEGIIVKVVDIFSCLTRFFNWSK